MSSDTLQLLVLIGIAAVVLYKLRSVIGTRTGHEGTPPYLRTDDKPRPAGPVAVPDPVEPDVPDPEVTGEHAETLARIRKVEPDFDLAGFVHGARGAYEMILMAFEEGDRDTLRSLLAPDVYRAFEAGIAAREEQGLRVEARFIGVREAEVEELAFDDDANIADVTMRFVGELITSVRDAENRVVEGDPNEVRRQSDTWTFSREMGSVDPNWLLTATDG